jgi:starch synthase
MDLAGKLGIERQVRFPGKADRAAAVSLFKTCEFFVLPSRQEPMGIVNLEAMAAGKAVVATRVGGVPEIVAEGETGMLVAPESPTDLALALGRLTADGPLCASYGKAGARRAAGFAWPAIAAEYRAIYSAAAGRGANWPLSAPNSVKQALRPMP